MLISFIDPRLPSLIPGEETNLVPDNCSFYPDDCLDPLTSELLSHPIRLPCGKHINLETLHKCWASRSASAPKYNPFTMVPMTASQVSVLVATERLPWLRSYCRQIQAATVVDEEKKREVAVRMKEHRQRTESFYDAILHPKKKYVPLADRADRDDDSDDENLAERLDDNVRRNFSFLFNKHP